ncbi:thioesterase family protein [Glaciecola sp. KUL10]|jgi:acyl-CoA thioester hydrolase|uniref:acyl-CoA thioesterase n=1 Tax=Glaciecola sp. (strain KUL10) TaxID=2161813 RepID=UPI000D78B64D|nr:acyl-CoA thioesterase [Glaciecola sp. KUL10]GBL03427.1 thioesterase superfamily protein [Glaciecola sp. KUL10]
MTKKADYPALKTNWFYKDPFVIKWKIDEASIDHYQHVNNVAYLSQLESLAWAHSNSLGLAFSDYQNANRAMVISKHELHYLQACHLNDEIACATWIVKCDYKFRLSRAFQFINVKTRKTVFKAHTDFISCTLDTGRPKPMPDLFQKIYGEACIHLEVASVPNE